MYDGDVCRICFMSARLAALRRVIILSCSCVSVQHRLPYSGPTDRGQAVFVLSEACSDTEDTL
jgi:hypothetical protein